MFQLRFFYNLKTTFFNTFFFLLFLSFLLCMDGGKGKMYRKNNKYSSYLNQFSLYMNDHKLSVIFIVSISRQSCQCRFQSLYVWCETVDFYFILIYLTMNTVLLYNKDHILCTKWSILVLMYCLFCKDDFVFRAVCCMQIFFVYNAFNLTPYVFIVI